MSADKIKVGLFCAGGHSLSTEKTVMADLVVKTVSCMLGAVWVPALCMHD